MKNYLYFSLFVLLAITACTPTPQEHQVNIKLETMGTWGSVKFVADSVVTNVEEIETAINNILIEVNQSFSTYDSTSSISHFNEVDTGAVFVGADFHELSMDAAAYYSNTNGALNVKILPLIEYYGFGAKVGSLEIDSSFVDSIVAVINQPFEEDISSIDMVTMRKHNPVQVDYSSFAKGYGVDRVFDYLSNLGCKNMMVEIGGEVHATGVNVDGNSWRLGIEEPNEEERRIYQVINLIDKSMATSGNYRNFRTLKSGQKLLHIINPVTGYPESSNLLSATIIAPSCKDADAYATAAMVMGLDKALQFVNDKEELEAFFIYSDKNGELQSMQTEGMQKFL